ncbi:MAG: dihydropteroate synthase [Dongiaceae bacterium]
MTTEGGIGGMLSPRNLSFYLRPTALIAGRAAARACAAGVALPLAGGPAAFAACELVLRPGLAVAATPYDLRGLRAWARRRGAAAVAAVEERLARLTAPRPDFAGLSLDRPLIMGVINVTPDSFSDGGDFAGPGAAIAQGRRLLAEGADILDIGGESTRPGATPVGVEEELARVLPVVRALAEAGAVVSIDSRQPAVMAAAVAAGARIVNDVSALTAAPDSLATAARSGAAVVLMHMRGDPPTMQADPRYADVALDIYDYLAARVAACRAAGIAPERIAVDPGIGFGKTLDHNIDLLAGLTLFHGLGCPLLLGVSRKGFISKLSRGEPAKERVAGSLAAGLAGLDQGVQILRVHDVAETFQARAMWQALAAGGRG